MSKPQPLHKSIIRPWGSYTILEIGQGYKIKRVVVNPKKQLSLQYHNQRSEHWVVIKGKARVRIGKKEIDLEVDQSIYVAKKKIHRLTNLQSKPLEIIEVQCGNYLEEDDIVRVDDDFGRHK